MEEFLDSMGTLSDIGDFTSGDALARELLLRLGLLPEFNPNKLCKRARCGAFFKAQNRSDSVIGWRYRCQVKRDGVRCNTYMNPLENSFLFHCVAALRSPKEIVALLWTFCMDMGVVKADSVLKLDRSTVSKWFSYLREVQMEVLFQRWKQRGQDGVGQIGGAGHIVEIDETHLAVRKYHRGGMLVSEDEWVFCGIDRTTHEMFAARVQHRGEDTLIPLLRRFVNPESLIISDGWSVYTNNINAENGFPFYQWINHSSEFVNQLDSSVHTQTIERFNLHLKQGITCYDPKNQNLDLQIASVCYSYERWGRGETLVSVVERMRILAWDMRIIYPGPGMERPQSPPWVHINPDPNAEVAEGEDPPPILWPPVPPFDMEPVIGINIEGVGYHVPLVARQAVQAADESAWQVINNVAVGLN